MHFDELVKISPDEKSAISTYNQYRPLFMFLDKDQFQTHIRKTLRFAYKHTGMNNQCAYAKGSNLVHKRDGENDLVIVYHTQYPISFGPNTMFPIRADVLPRMLTILKSNNEVYDIKSVRIRDGVNVVTTSTIRIVNGKEEQMDMKCEYEPGDPNIKFISEITYTKIDPMTDPELPKEVQYVFNARKLKDSWGIARRIWPDDTSA